MINGIPEGSIWKDAKDGECAEGSCSSVDRTAEFHEIVRAKRRLLGLPTPESEVLRRRPRRSAFEEEAHDTLTKIETMSSFLRDNHTAYVLDDGLHGMTEAERDEVDSETKLFLKACGERIDRLRAQSAEDAAASEPRPSGGVPQLAAHRRGLLEFLHTMLQRVTAVFDEHRGLRLQRAVDERDTRLGAAALAAGTFDRGGALEGGGGAGGGALGGLGARLGAGLGLEEASAESGEVELTVAWEEHEVVEDEELGATERAQLQLENEALHKQLATMVEQAREAESSMVEIANLSHMFASKVEQQGSEVAQLYSQAEQTSENLVRGNAYLDSAAKHSRDFRLLVLTFLLVTSFGLLFLDYFYD